MVIKLRCPKCNTWIRENNEELSERTREELWMDARAKAREEFRGDACERYCLVCGNYDLDGVETMVVLRDCSSSPEQLYWKAHKRCVERPAKCCYCGKELGEERAVLRSRFACFDCAKKGRHYYVVADEEQEVSKR